MMSSTERNTLLFKALETGLALATSRDWTSITLLEITNTAGLDLKDLYALNGRDAITDSLDAWADQAMFSEDVDMEDTPRERLFEVIMRRFEAMEPHRAGIISLMSARDKMPRRRVALLAARKRTAQWARVCSGLDTISGAEQTLNTVGLVWVLRQTELAWRRETGTHFTQTMAALDEELLRLEERDDRTQRFFSTSPFARNHPAQETTEAGSMSPEVPQAESDPA